MLPPDMPLVSAAFVGSLGLKSLPSKNAVAENLRFAASTTFEGLTAVRPYWRELEERSANSNQIFQGHDWCFTWADCATRARYSFSPYVVAAYEANRLVLLWPLMIVRKNGMRILRWLSEPWAQYGDVLVSPDHDASLLMRLAVRHIRKDRVADVMWLRHVRDDAACHDFLTNAFWSAGYRDGAPYMDLTKYADEREYLARYSGKRRRHLKKARSKLEASGPIGFEISKDASSFRKIVTDVLCQKRLWLNERGLHSEPIASAWLEDFLIQLASRSGGLNLVTSATTAGSRAVAYEIGLRYRDRHCNYITAHDVSLTDFSPARLHMEQSQCQAIKDRVKVYDLMVPLDRHKEGWISGHVAVSDYWLPLSLAGQVSGRLYFSLARPLARKAYRKAPPRLRRLMKNLIGG
jgi:CelD/BcsL family acetyltransferase involved in cellulose biosynthesis